MSYDCRHYNPQQNTNKPNPTTYKKDYMQAYMRFIPGKQDW